jgi:hypothetical protein
LKTGVELGIVDRPCHDDRDIKAAGFLDALRILNRPEDAERAAQGKTAVALHVFWKRGSAPPCGWPFQLSRSAHNHPVSSLSRFAS